MKTNKEEIKAILVSREGYNSAKADAVATDLIGLDAPLAELLLKWLNDPSCKGDFAAEGVSLFQLQKKLKLNYPASLLTMDWIIKDPENAVVEIKNRFRI